MFAVVVANSVFSTLLSSTHILKEHNTTNTNTIINQTGTINITQREKYLRYAVFC